MSSVNVLTERAAASDWPRALGPPRVTAALRTVPEDFEVEEQPRMLPEGRGDHLWLWIEKRGANTSWVAARLARLAGCRQRDVGFAGMKDRHAVTRQWFSLPLPAQRDPEWRDGCIDGVRVLDVQRHGRKLQRGALTGNVFRIRLRRLAGDSDELLERLRHVDGHGVPNYFGEQRFGRAGANVRRGIGWLLQNESLSRSRRGIHLSALRSILFNEVLARRVADGSWRRMLNGEIAMLDGTHSVFRCGNIDEELERRCRERDIHPTGPLPGRPGVEPDADAAALEWDVLQPCTDLVAALAAAGVTAERRSLRMVPEGLQWQLLDDGIELRFRLPAGGYATAVLRELVTPER